MLAVLKVTLRYFCHHLNSASISCASRLTTQLSVDRLSEEVERDVCKWLASHIARSGC